MQKNKLRSNAGWLLFFIIPIASSAQTTDSTLTQATLANVISYALEHQPLVQQAEVDQQITSKVVNGKLADWLPQINFNYNYQRFFDLQSNVIGGNLIRFGANNTSYAQLSVTQAIFNRDVLLAAGTASDIKTQAVLNTTKSKIDITANVMKAFYDVLATEQQIRVNEESITRLQRSQQDANSRYEAGIADKTDFKRATILLSNARVSLKSNQELLGYKLTYLKKLMGYPADKELPLQYDTLQMENQILIDTLQAQSFQSHIDYKLLTVQRELQDANVRYSKWAYLPTLSAYGAYNLNYQNNSFGELYQQDFPYSYVGATLTVPIFQGGKRALKVQEQKLSRQRIDYSFTNLENTLNSEYTRVLASYKVNLANYHAQKDNVVLAKEVYDIIQLQYSNGLKTYLDVITAESDLNTARINYFNALYQILASKVDVMQTLGQINY